MKHALKYAYRSGQRSRDPHPFLADAFSASWPVLHCTPGRATSLGSAHWRQAPGSHSGTRTELGRNTALVTGLIFSSSS